MQHTPDNRAKISKQKFQIKLLRFEIKKILAVDKNDLPYLSKMGRWVEILVAVDEWCPVKKVLRLFLHQVFEQMGRPSRKEMKS
jgi:hypothetical protein